MDIESKKWRIVSKDDGTFLAEIRHKPSGTSNWVASSKVPAAHTLAMMKEADFDRKMDDLFNG